MSIQAQKSGQYDELLQSVAYAPLDERDVYGGMVSYGPVYEHQDDEGQYAVQEWDKLAGDLFSGSQLFSSAGTRDKIAMLRAWRGDAQWVYGLSHAEDGLWGQDVASRRVLFDRMSGYVLSGMLGEGLLREDASLRRVAKKIETSPLDRAILVGGAALAARSAQRAQYDDGGSYLGFEDDGVQFETWTGGDIHGDFRTSRFARPIEHVTTTLDTRRVHPFMPVSGAKLRVAAYHGVEERIISALLIHLVNNTDADASVVHAEIMKELRGATIHYGGAFGEYDVSDGDIEAGKLRILLATPELARGKEQLMDTIVYPGSSQRFRMVSREQGALLMNTADGHEPRLLLIPNEEISQYIATLVRGGGGRTGPRAMLNVIRALLPEDAV